MKRIPLSATKPKGRTPRAYALVDDADYERLTALCAWQASEFAGQVRAVAEIDSVRQQMSRVIMGVAPGEKVDVDHIDGDTLNNQRTNLRVCTHAENQQNRRPNRGARSPFRGVSLFGGGKWRAAVSLRGHTHRLGLFDDELDAAIAAQAFRDKHMPFAQPDPALLDALEGRAA